MSDDDDDIDPCFVCGSRGGTSGESAEIARLTAALARVRGQRDRVADALNGFDYDGHGKFLRTFGLVKVDGEWKEIEG